MRPITGRSIPPAQAIPNDVDDAAEDAAITDTRNTPKASGTDVECVSSVLRDASKNATWTVLLSPLNHEAENIGTGQSKGSSADKAAFQIWYAKVRFVR